MQIVIDIPEGYIDKINSIKDDRELSQAQLLTVYRGFHAMLQNATPLPKGHGRLIDADATISKICGRACGCHLEECGLDEPCFSVTWINSALTVIEAESEET